MGLSFNIEKCDVNSVNFDYNLNNSHLERTDSVSDLRKQKFLLILFEVSGDILCDRTALQRCWSPAPRHWYFFFSYFASLFLYVLICILCFYASVKSNKTKLKLPPWCPIMRCYSTVRQPTNEEVTHFVRIELHIVGLHRLSYWVFSLQH